MDVNLGKTIKNSSNGGNMYDIIIIGAGPAGLTSALYALRAKKKVLMLEATAYGGQILNAHRVENYPGIESISGVEFAKTLFHQVEKLGVEIRFEPALLISEDKEVTTNKGTYKGRSIIIATGAKNRKLNLDREQDFIGKGVSYCATCDGTFYKNKVYLIHRRDRFRGEEKYAKELEECENVSFVMNAEVKALYGSSKLEKITVLKEGKEEELEVDGLFIAIGQEPKNEMFSNVIDLDEKGYILSPDGVHTKTPMIYVAGDNQVKLLRQLTTAVSDGSLAATVAIREMKNQEE